MPKRENQQAIEAVDWFTKHYGATHGCIIVTWPIAEEVRKGDVEVAHTSDRPTDEALGIATMGLTRLANSIYERGKKATDL